MSVRVIITNANKEAEIKFSLTSSQIMEILNNFLSKFKYGEDQWKRYWAYNFDSEHVYFHDNEESKDFRAKYSIAKLVATVDVENKEEVIEGCPGPVEVTEYMPFYSSIIFFILICTRSQTSSEIHPSCAIYLPMLLPASLVSAPASPNSSSDAFGLPLSFALGLCWNEDIIGVRLSTHPIALASSI